MLLSFFKDWRKKIWKDSLLSNERQRWIREIWKFACGRKLRSMNVVDGECFGKAAARKNPVIQINKRSTDHFDTMECSVGKYYSLEFALVLL